MRRLVLLLLVLSACGCTKPPVAEETVVLDAEPVINYYALGGGAGALGEAFFAASGGEDEVKEKLREVAAGGAADTSFAEGETLNFVVFRGVFSTGGYGIRIDRVEQTGSMFAIHATYSEPGEGMMVTQAISQPTAIIPLGVLQKGSYDANLLVTKISNDEAGERVIEEDIEHARVGFTVN